MQIIHAQAVQAHLNSVGIGCAIGNTGLDHSVVFGNEIIFDYTEAKSKATLLVYKIKHEQLTKV